MVSNNQVRRLRELMAKDNRIIVNAAKTGMDVKTARKYLHQDGLPSELATVHAWRTREDPFSEVWKEVNPFLELNPGLEAKTLFEYLQRIHPGRFPEGQLRSFQRGVRRWRALEGPPKEVFFAQEHQPGYLCQSDFTYMHELGVTIGGEVFDHLLYHFVLTYSNWESGTVCFSESYESLSEGLQAALWELGAVPAVHQTDRMTAAVCHPGREVFTQRYAGLLRHYGLEGRYCRVQHRMNVEGTLLVLAEAGRRFARQNLGGDVVLISTKNVFAPGAGFGAYSATKAAAHQLARIASLEFAPLGVRVNMVAPDAVFSGGTHKSGLWAEVGPGRMKARGLDEKGLEDYYRNRNLLKAKVTAEHVANAVLFFALRQTPTTGACIPVDGGLPDATPR